MSKPRQYDAFVSYNRRDRRLIDVIARKLAALGVRCWVDRDLRPGVLWLDELSRAFEAIGCCLACFGRSNPSQGQCEEIRWAVQRRMENSESFRIVTALLPGRENLPRLI